MHHPTDRITHTTAFVTPVVEHWLQREIGQNYPSGIQLYFILLHCIVLYCTTLHCIALHSITLYYSIV